MAEYDKQKNISASTLLSFKELQDKLQKVIDRSNDTIGTHK